ncbi:MAG: ATP-dependent DNA helicase, partial [Candidatus Nanoarchaeia archaeon]
MSKNNDVALFPFDEERDAQTDLMGDIAFCLRNKVHCIAHAPTGLGKTVAVLAPALKYAIDNKKTVFFLTSRHTQHHIAIATLRAIKEKHGVNVAAVDLIGKQYMCPVTGVTNLHSGDFHDYCEKQRDEGKCGFYCKTRKSNKLTAEAKDAMDRMLDMSPLHVEDFKEITKNEEFCTYELASSMGSKARVIVADYYTIFHSMVSSTFLKKTALTLDNAIVIIDEAHNLPSRIRSLLTSQISSAVVKRSIKEAEKYELEDALMKLKEIESILHELSENVGLGEEMLLKKDDFISRIEEIGDYDELIEDIENAADIVREKEKQSAMKSISRFLEMWKGCDEAHVRFVSKRQSHKGDVVVIHYHCLDPSIQTKNVIEQCHSVIAMSGTLRPTAMYRDILGFPERTMEREYESPFPHENRLNMIIPETTTKYSLRNDDQFKRMAEIIAEATNEVPGNCAVFFPSYYLRDQVYKFLHDLSEKTAFVEQQEMTKEEKAEFLERFKSYHNTGAVLLGAMTGSYGEGIDLPGDFL